MGAFLTVLIVIAAAAAVIGGLAYARRTNGGCKCGCSSCSDRKACRRKKEEG